MGSEGGSQRNKAAMDRIRNIKDLAVLAGVSAGTVSRALAGSDLISMKTRERIQALADLHGFRPNALARNLRIQRTAWWCRCVRKMASSFPIRSSSPCSGCWPMR